MVTRAEAEPTISPRQHTRKVWFHLDLDGLDAIYECHGRRWESARDDFYVSGVESSLALFAEQGMTATCFVIARDLANPVKRRAIEAIVRAGHHVACHSRTHRDLRRLTSSEKRDETAAARASIEDALGVSCRGFRAPSYSIDAEVLRCLDEGGYAYDSSMFPGARAAQAFGLERVAREPFRLFPGRPLLEVPMPYLAPGLPPFHPCYAFYLTRLYFALCVRAFARRHARMTLLFHLTDFATPSALPQGFALDVYTNNFGSRDGKLAFVRRLVAIVRRDFAFTTTEAELEAGTGATRAIAAPLGDHRR
jgi:peptidoglycan/xylan/chitin deacetylase (PgdA/CDA1 family)